MADLLILAGVTAGVIVEICAGIKTKKRQEEQARLLRAYARKTRHLSGRKGHVDMEETDLRRWD